MLDVIMSEYYDFNIYSPVTEKPSVVYLEFSKHFTGDKEAWKWCPVVKIINREDYNEPEDYNDAVEKIISEANGLTGEIINNDYSIYIEVDTDNAICLTEKPQLKIVRYC